MPVRRDQERDSERRRGQAMKIIAIVLQEKFKESITAMMEPLRFDSSLAGSFAVITRSFCFSADLYYRPRSAVQKSRI